MKFRKLNIVPLHEELILAEEHEVVARIRAKDRRDYSEAQDNAEDIVKRYNAYLELVSRLDGILCELEDSGTATDATVQEARQALTDLGWNEQALGELADHNEGPTMNIYQWAEDRKVDELAAHAIAYHFAGYKYEDNPFTAKGSFYESGWTSIRDSNNPVPHQWSVLLFDLEATIASCLDGMNVIDTEELDKWIDTFNEQARLSYETMNPR